MPNGRRTDESCFMIFCAAGDPGGSRAILPVVLELARRNFACRVLDHGFLGKELPELYRNLLCPQDDAERILTRCSVFLFGSSTQDAVPLALGRAAKALNKPVVHLLDNWSSYARRLATDGKEMLIPDKYMVMDEAARIGAIADGIPASCLAVTGHPALAEIVPILKNLQYGDRKSATLRLGLPVDRLLLAFICEPFKAVFGEDENIEGHPGFTEETVLTAFTDALAPYAGEIYLVLLPHPKQSLREIRQLWRNVGGRLNGCVISLPQGRDILPAVDGIAGMASILLYEAWLGGLPVFSLQPGCRLPALRRFALLDGVTYVATLEALPAAVVCLLNCCRNEWSGKRLPPPLPELALHENAPRSVVDILIQLTKGKPA
jgi:hypothetical protein